MSGLKIGKRFIGLIWRMEMYKHLKISDKLVVPGPSFTLD